MEQTAVEWLFEQLWDTPKDKLSWYSLLNKAKQIEEESTGKIFNYFTEKFGITPIISQDEDDNWSFYIPATQYNELPLRVTSDTWDREKIQIECIKKIIEIVSQKN